MRRIIAVALPLFALTLAGCPRGQKDGDCKSSEDCAAQQGYGKVCIEGKCQECGRNEDCPAGFVCKDLKCAPKPECDEQTPCPAGQACEAGRCTGTALPPDAAGAATQQPTEPTGPVCELQRVQFAFDDASLKSDARDALAANADCIKQMNVSRVRIEGHCDERGTNEYNQHLGQRRAEAVRRYLANLGLDGGMFDAVSFGEEQPLCTESSEDCWQQNRRAEIKAQ
jgi:peptidoglycan-associated lipoprotein